MSNINRPSHRSARAAIGALLLLVGTIPACNQSSPTEPERAPIPTLPSGPRPAPTITSIAPHEGLAGLSMAVAIVGNGFQPGLRVTIGDPALSSATNGTLISAATPVHAPGVVDVTVTNPDGQSATLIGGYAYRSVTLNASQLVVAPGAPVSVSWVAPGRANPDVEGDWLGLFRPESPDGTFIWGKYSTGAAGTLTLNAPTEPGTYEFRYLAGDGHVAPSVVMARIPVRVSGF